VRPGPRLAPDFAIEFERCDELERTFDDSTYWTLQFREWVDDVHGKLLSWSSQKANRFLSTSIFESSGGSYMLDEHRHVNSGLVELQERRRRLELLMQPTLITWITSLFRP